MTKSNVPAKANASLPAVPGGDFFEEYSGAGLENVTASDMLVPRLTIIQGLSPQLQKNKGEYIEGAEIGDIVDVATGDLFKGSILFLPVYYKKEYLEWAPRKSSQGLVQIHSDPAILEKTIRNEKNQPLLPNGNLIAETAQFYGFNLTAGRRRCFLPMSSTQLKKARKWITLATSEKLKRGDGSEYVPALFYRAYELSTCEESNAEGDWSGWVVNRGPALHEIDFGFDWKVVGHEAVSFREMLKSGEMRGDVASMQGAEEQTEVM